MKKFLAAALSCALIAGSITAPAAAANNPVGELAAENRTIAFKGAEGGGMYTKGARAALESGDAIEVYHVTNLNDSGEGSFRDAVSKGNRIVVFDVSGYIDLSSNVTIGHDNMTILGQTAPGDGVCFRSNNIKVGADNVILRYLRFRVGAKDAAGNDTRAQDGLEVTDDCQNVIIDHCSVSWGTDENLSAYAVKDVTIQNSIIAEALNQSVHDKGEHSYAAIWGGVNLSIHHNLIATHKSRNPKIGTSETVAMTAGYTDAQTLVDMKNNVFYNWGDKAGYGTENGAKTYIQNNVYRPGPATPAGKRARIFELSVGQKYQTNMFGSVYAVGNKIDVDANDSDKANADKVNENNWQDDLHTGVYTDTKFYEIGDKTNIKIETPNEDYQNYNAEYHITLDDTDDVYEKVLSNAGATLPKRDKVDERIIDNVKTRTAPNGSKGSVGLVDDPTDGVPAGATDYDDRGYPTFSTETRAADFDTDKDGIPDEWENSHKLNAADPKDSVAIGPEGYTWFEIYVEDAITKSEYADNLGISLTMPNGIEYGEEVVISPGNLGEGVTNVEFYCDDKLLGTADKADGKVEFKTSAIKAGTRYITAIAKDGAGNRQISNTVKLSCYTKTDAAAIEKWSGKNAALIYGNYVLGPSGELSQTVSGDFDFVAEIEELGTLGNNCGVQLTVGDANVSIGYEDYSLGIKCNGAMVGNTNEEDYINYDEYKLLKISRSGNTLTVSIGKNLADWKDVGTVKITDASATLTVKSGIGDGSGNSGVVILNILRVITADMKTAPQAAIVNIVENQRLGFSENIEVAVTPDSKAGISEIYVYLTENEVDKLLAEYKTNELITETKTISIPVSFATIAKGSIKTVAIDANLGTAIASKNVVVSQDITPWNIADIGGSPEGEKTYVSATDDYTFKINCDVGEIGGAADKCGYMYQSFTGDGRIYYRSRMQDSKQFGIMFRNDLDADGVAYYFGGNVDEDKTLKYQLTARTSKGEEMILVKDVTADIGSSKNLYFIAEKIGDTINIYQTENGSTVYTTKTLIASVKADGIGDTYYMGYAVAYNGSYGAEADSGWVGIDKIQSDGISYKWDFDNGLDWTWQMQEKNVLRPKFEAGTITGNSTGKMLIAPDENYSGDRYIFHEYLMEDKYLPKLNTDVLLTGDAPALNVYFQTGNKDNAYKVMFADDGNIYVNEAPEDAEAAEAAKIGTWEIGKWYNVEIATVLDDTTNFEPAGKITVKDESGNVAGSLNNAPISGSGKFRTQINVEKKYPVTKAVYFEPVSTAKGSYYIDNVEVTAVQGRYSVSKTENTLKFTDETGTLGNKTYDNGFEIKASLAVDAKGGNVSDESFTNRVTMNKGSNTSSAIVIPTGLTEEGSCDIQIYAAQGGSSGERYIVLTDGSKELSRILIGSANRFDYTYTGSADKLIAYSTSKIYVYGVKVINTKVVDNGGGEQTYTTEIKDYDAATGNVSITIGNTNVNSVTVVVAAYDADNRLLDVVNSEDFTVTANSEVTVPTTPIESKAASYKVFLFNNLTSISPLAAVKPIPGE